MRHRANSLAQAAVCWLILAGSLFAGPIQIEQDTTWSGERTIDHPVTVLVDTRLANWESEKTIVKENYIHNQLLNGSFGLLHIRGTICDNVVRGGTWTTCAIGGTIVGNVIGNPLARGDQEILRSGFQGQLHPREHQHPVEQVGRGPKHL